MKYTAVICASGTGSRLNLGYNKVFYQLDDNDRIIDKSIKVFLSDKECVQIIVVTQIDNFELLDNFKSLDNCNMIKLVEGKDTRTLSVYEGLKLTKTDYVMIHDGARPYLSTKIIDDIKKELVNYDSVVVGVKSVDTVKVVDKYLHVIKTLDRDTLYNAQTPQAFKTSVVLSAYDKVIANKLNVTDDVSCVEICSDTITKVVIGDYKNIKITNVSDIKR